MKTKTLDKHPMMNHSNYLPLISLETGGKFVYSGSYFEDENKAIILTSGEVCRRWATFPN